MMKPFRKIEPPKMPVCGDLSVVIDDDFIFIVNVFNRYNQSITHAICATNDEAIERSNTFRDDYKDDRYYQDHDGKIVTVIERKPIITEKTKLPLSIKCPRE